MGCVRTASLLRFGLLYFNFCAYSFHGHFPSPFLVFSGAAGGNALFIFLAGFLLSVLSGAAGEVSAPSLVPQLVCLDLSGLGQAGPEVPSELAPPAFLPYRFHHVRVW